MRRGQNYSPWAWSADQPYGFNRSRRVILKLTKVIIFLYLWHHLLLLFFCLFIPNLQILKHSLTNRIIITWWPSCTTKMLLLYCIKVTFRHQSWCLIDLPKAKLLGLKVFIYSQSCLSKTIMIFLTFVRCKKMFGRMFTLLVSIQAKWGVTKDIIEKVPGFHVLKPYGSFVWGTNKNHHYSMIFFSSGMAF